MRRGIRKPLWLTGIVLAMAVCSIGALSQTKEATEMNPKTVQQEAFTVVGIAIRTSNAEQMTEARPIGKQWERLFKDGVLAAIPNKADGNILAVYSEYASDKDGEYSYLLGARVTKVESVPAGMTVKNVPAGKYAVFTSDRGPVQKKKKWSWRCGSEFGRRRRARWAEIGVTRWILKCTTSERRIRRTLWWICMWR